MLNHLSRLSLQCGAPRGSEYKAAQAKPICDEWHQSLTAICPSSISDDLYMHYAYFTSTVRLMRASHPPPSIEDFTKDRPKLSITIRRAVPSEVHGQSIATNPTPRVSVMLKQDTANTGPNQNMISNPYATLCKSDSTAADSTLKSRLRKRDVIESEHSSLLSHDMDLERSHTTPRQLVVVDLTDRDSEEEIKSEPAVSSAPLNHDEHDISSEQRLRDILQSKKVSEIKHILAEKSGQLPDWIEEVARQEMEKKMARDLEMVRNFF
jgi:hypothetical protein